MPQMLLKKVTTTNSAGGTPSRAKGRANADCRANGRDFDAGAAALRAYTKGWPKRGTEMRRQYVLIQWIDPEREGGGA